MVRRVADVIFMPFTVGGGIRTLEDATRLIQAGAEKVSINSAAVKNPDLVRQVSGKFGRCATVVNIDPRRVRKPRSPHPPTPSPTEGRGGARAVLLPPLPSVGEGGGGGEGEEWWEVHINGGRVPTGLEAVAWAREVQRLGAGEIILTSMDADGTKNGYDIEMTRAVSEAVSVPVVASGGAGHPDHLFTALTEGKADAALAASIFHYNEFDIPSTKSYLARRGVPVRLVDR
jgi:cyclase